MGMGSGVGGSGKGGGLMNNVNQHRKRIWAQVQDQVVKVV